MRIIDEVFREKEKKKLTTNFPHASSTAQHNPAHDFEPPPNVGSKHTNACTIVALARVSVSTQLLERNLFMTAGSNGVVTSVFTSSEAVLVLPVTSLSKPLGVIAFMSSFR